MTRSEKLVEVYLGWLVSTDGEAGWHQPSMLQRMIEFGGDIPPPTGNDQSDLKMISEIRFLRESHALLPLAKSVVGGLNNKYKIPLLLKTRYASTVNPETGRRWTTQTLAQAVGLRHRQFEHRAKQALRMIERRVEANESEQVNGPMHTIRDATELKAG